MIPAFRAKTSVVHTAVAHLKANRFFFIAFFAYCYIYSFALALMMLDRVPPGTEWMASIMQILGGIVAAVWMAINYGRGRSIVATLMILCLTCGVEAVGVVTGFPFGQYDYSDVLAPKLFGIVPLGITFAWLMVILASFFTARFLIDRLFPLRTGNHARRRSSATIGLTALLAVAADLQMEPVAVHLKGYWTWTNDGGWYGVPISNFVAWFATSVVMALVLVRVIGRGSQRLPFTRETARYGWLPLALYQMNLLLFAAVNLTHPFVNAGLIGLLVEVGLVGAVILVRPAPKLTLPTFVRLSPVARPLVVEVVDDAEQVDVRL